MHGPVPAAYESGVGLVMNGTTYSFVYDIAAGIPAVIVEGDGVTPVYYFREPNGALVARSKAGEGRRYYHFDDLGSTRVLTDGSGNVTDRYSYDAWGGAISHDRFAGSVGQPYQYVGRRAYYTHCQDPDLKLLQLGVRFYDPEIGRFTQSDPIGFAGGPNEYVYADGAPVANADPTGFSAEPPEPDYQFKVLCDYGGGRYEFRVWTRDVHKFHVGTFLGCLVKELSIRALWCSILCGIASIKGPGAFSDCMLGCMSPGPGDEPVFADCYDEAWWNETQYYGVNYCWATGGTCSLVDKPEPDPRDGWKPYRPR